jgi:GNAT superfamily N-acetyltransferase
VAALRSGALAWRPLTAADLVVSLDGRPIGLVQRSVISDYPEDLAEFAAIVDVPDCAVELDYLIGDAALRGRGLGARLIAAAVENTWTDYPGAIPEAALARGHCALPDRAGGIVSLDGLKSRSVRQRQLDELL